MAKSLSIQNNPAEILSGPQLLHDLVLWDHHPDICAIDFTTGDRRQRYSYRELQSCVAVLALKIKEILASSQRTTPDVILVFLPQSPGLYISYLAILVSGKAFCPVKLDTPRSRIKFIVDNTATSILITTSDLHDLVSWEDGPTVILVDEFVTSPNNVRRIERPQNVKPDDLAYVMYTSGSTGQPKGVQVTHMAVSQSLLAHQRHIPSFKRFLQFAAPSFDVSVFEIFFTLSRACTIVGCDRSQLLNDLSGTINKLKVDAAELTPTVISSLIERRSNVPGLKLLISTGEFITIPILREFGGSETKPSILYSLYGPTEATIHCTISPNMSATTKPNNVGVPLCTVSTFIAVPISSTENTAKLEFLPIGEIGELVLAGPQLSRGYFNNSEQNKLAFISHEGRKYYRTGDKARQLKDGSIELYGRIYDDQVKLRGQRVELGEIEDAIYRHPGIKFVTSTVVNNAIIGFAIVDDRVKDSKEVMETCAKWLPKSILPREIILRTVFPYLASGKVDKKRLVLEYQEERIGKYSDDQIIESEPERLVKSILYDIFGPFSRESKLSAIGLDSLSAIKVTSKLRASGFTVNIILLLQAQNLDELVKLCIDSKILSSQNSNLLLKRNQRNCEISQIHLSDLSNDIEYILPCTPQQLAMLSESVRDETLYRNWIKLDIKSSINSKNLIQILHELSKSNPILRTGFMETQNPSGYFQLIYKKIHDTRFELVSSFKYEFNKLKDSSLEFPIRFQILSQFSNFKVLIHIHHALYDAWTLDLLLDDLNSLLASRPLFKRPSFELVVDSFLEVEDSNTKNWSIEDYWKDYLAHFNPKQLPSFCANSKPVEVLSISRLQTSLLFSDVEAASRRLLTSSQSIFQAAFALILSSYLGAPDICFGTVFSGRTLPIDGIESIVGPCIVTLPIRIDITTSEFLHDLVQQLNHTNRKHLEYIKTPLRDIKMAGRFKSDIALFDTLLILQQTLHPSDNFREHVSLIDSEDIVEFNLILEIIPHIGNVEFKVTYRQRIIPEFQVKLFLRQIEQLTRQILSKSKTPLNAVFKILDQSLLSIANENPITTHLDTRLHSDVEEIALRNPNRPAIIFANSLHDNEIDLKTVSYSELNSRANKMARYLIELGASSDQLVCICLEKSIELYTCILATTKAGAAWLPLMPDTPLERLDSILRQSRAKFAVIHSSLWPKFASRSIKVLLVDKIDISPFSANDLGLKASLDNLAYAIFTSGSTGKPKGVLITQRNILSNLSALESLYPRSKETRLLQFCSHTFDVSVADIFFTWRIGGCLCSAKNDILFQDLEYAICTMKITHLSLTTTVASLINPENVPCVEFLVVAGEVMTSRIYNSWAHRNLWIGYGPSETTNVVTLSSSGAGDFNLGSIGYVLNNTSAFVLSSESDFIPVPRGGEGELCFGGSQIFRGYMESENNKGKIIDHPKFGRIYRSGDFGRLMPDGSFVFLGRKDDRVKIRGQRVELGEINNVVISSNPEISNCTTILIESKNKTDRRLVCFWTPKNQTLTEFKFLRIDKNTVTRLHQSISSALPSYMIPSAVIPVTFLPTTSSGKIDSARLVNLFHEISVSYLESPLHVTESLLSYQWDPIEKEIAIAVAQITHKSLREIKANTSFFSLGFDSISAIHLAKILKQSINYQLTVSEILRFPSVVRLAERISDGKDKKPTLLPITSTDFSFDQSFRKSIVQEYKVNGKKVQSILPCTPLQEAMLSAAELSNRMMYYNQVVFKIKIDILKLEQFWNEMVRRHGILRTCFKRTELQNNIYVQVILSDYDLRFGSINQLSENMSSFDSLKPPYSLDILRNTKTDKLVITMHHALYDATAISILYDEIQALNYGQSLEPAISFEPFLKFLESDDFAKSDHFWAEYLKNCPFSKFKSEKQSMQFLASPQTSSIVSASSLKWVEMKSMKHETSLLSIFMTVWASVLAETLRETDVCFGNVTSGRNISTPNIERLVAPCFNTIPSRIKNIQDLSYIEAYRIFQKFNAEVLPFQFMPLRRIQSKLSHDGSPLFDTIFIMQRPKQKLDDSIWSIEKDTGYTQFPLVFELVPDSEEDNILVSLHSYSTIISENDAIKILKSFDERLHEGLQNPRIQLLNSTLKAELIHKKFARAKKKLSMELPPSRALSKDETELREIIAEFSDIPVNKINLNDSFFFLGLDSINILQFASRLRKRGHLVQASDIFENPNIKKLINFLKTQDENLIRDKNLRIDPLFNLNKNCRDYICHTYGIPKENIDTIRPCTSFQQGMIARTIQSNGKEYFNSFWLKFPIQTSITKLKDAWTVACQNHEIFRSGFASTEDFKHPFVMITYRNFTLPWVETDMQPQDEVETLKRILYRPWCLKFRSLEDKIIIQFIIHHALYDAISIQMFFTDIARSYKSLDSINRPPINLLLNAILLESENKIEEKKSFWNMNENKDIMNRFPDLNPVKIFETSCKVQEHILKFKSSVLEAQCRENSITMQTAAQAAWARLLASYIGGISITFGTVLSGRSVHEDADQIPFPSAVTLPVHCNLSGTNAEVLARTMHFNSQVYRHQFTPLAFIQKWSESPNSSNFDTIFTYQKVSNSENDIKVPWEIFKEDSFVDYVLSLELLSLANDQIKSRLTFKLDMIPPKQAQIILNQYEVLLLDLLLNLDNPCDIAPQIDPSLLSITPAEEPELSGSTTLIHEFVVCGAQKHPEKIALEFATNLDSKNFHIKCWTYDELDKISNQVANYLLQFEFEPGKAIAICFDKCPEAYFANIGILKAGYVYVALDPNSPMDRLKFILKDSEAKAILMDGKTIKKMSKLSNEFILNLDLETISRFSQEPPNLSRQIKPEDISYYLYTSGTTGTPKGCMITHENVVQFSRAFSRILDGHWMNESRFLQFASYHFDVSIMEQFWSWSVGICVVSAPRDLIFENITGAIQALGITHIDLTPSLARMINPEDVPSLCRGVFITGGEQLEQEILDKWSAFGCLYNAYGPTEVTIGCTINPRISSNDKPTNIGPAYLNVGTYVLKPGTELPTLRGGIGELCVSGKLICKGYLNNAELTSQKFQTLKKSNEKVYRTGDLVRMLHDESFIFLGRADSQVKLRGQRLEITEIKEVIRKNIQEVEEVIILILKHKTRMNDHLIAFFVTCSSDPSEIIQAMRSACKSWLPGYMVPSHFIPVKNIPLNLNNKVDTKRLAAIYNEFTIEDLQKLSLMNQQGSKWSLREKEIISKISSALRVDKSILERNTNIFELGLDSVSMIGFSRALQNLGLKNARLSMIRKNPSINGLVKALLSKNTSDSELYNAYMSASQKIIAFSQKHIFAVCKELGVEKDEIESISPCTPIQEGMIYKYMENEHALYFNKILFRLLEKVDTQKLLAAWNHIVSQLEVLRIKFIATDDGFCQVVMRKNIVSWERAKDYKAMDKMDALRNPFCLSLDKNILIFQIFHGLYDETSLILLLRHVLSRYNDINTINYGPSFISSLPYGPLANITGAEEFWNSHFKEWSPSSISVDSHSTDYVTKITSFINLDGFEALRKKLGVAPQAIIEACWITALQTKVPSDFMMGIVVSGRAIELKDTSIIVGPLFNTIPFYINMKLYTTLEEVISVCQEFNLQMQEFQHTSLNDIKRWVQAKHGIFENFQTIFNFQRQEMDVDELSNDLWQVIDSDPILDYPLALEAKLSLDSRQLSLSVFAHSSILTKDDTATLINQTEDLIRDTLSSAGKNRVSNSLVLRNYSPEPNYRLTLKVRSPEEDSGFGWTSDTLTIRKEVAILANINQDIVKESSSIYELGLDSIDVIKLFSRLKKQDVEITVSDIIKCQTISRMADKIKKVKEKPEFFKAVLQNISQKLMAYFKDSDILTDDVETILPATPLQQSMVSKMESSNFEIYFTVDGFKVGRNVDLVKLKDAIEKVIQASPILRTSFYEVDDPKIPVRYSQIVYKYLKNSFEYQSIILDPEQTFDKHLNQFRKEVVRQAKETRRLFYFRYVSTRGNNYLIIAISHALYDGKSLQLIHEDIKRAYNDQMVRRPDFMPYLEQILLSTTENAKSFWRTRLSDLPATKIPIKQSDILNSRESFLLKKKSRVLLADIKALCKSVRVTIQTLGQTCWALVLSHLMKQLDVVFGTVITGRNSEEASEIMFPLMNAIILRSVIHGNLAEMLQYMQGISDSNLQYQNFPISMAQVYAFSSRKKDLKFDETNLFDSLFIYQGRQLALDKNLLYEWEYGISEIDIPICVEMQVTSDDYLFWTTACKSTVRSRSETEDLLEALDFTLERIIHSTKSPSTIFYEDGVSICGLPKFILSESQADKKKSDRNFQRIEDDSSSTIELYIRRSLCEISGVPEEEIHQNMTIYHLGLDSILVLKLPALLRNHGVKISVSNILKGQTISEISKSAEIVETNPSMYLDFEKILADATSSSVLSRELEILETEIGRIQYVMPATAGQCFMIRQWQVNHGAIFNGGFKHVISSQFKQIDLELAWSMLLSRHDILRTGFLDDGIDIYQVIFKNPPNEIIYYSEQGNLETHISRSNLKRPPLNLIVQKLQNHRVRLNFMIHHVLYDGISLQNLLSEFLSLYQGLKIESSTLSFKPFVAQSIFYSSMNDMQEKWKSYLIHYDNSPSDPVNEKALKPRIIFASPSNKIQNIIQKAKEIGSSVDALFLAVLVKVQAERLQKRGSNISAKSLILGLYVANRAPYGDDLSMLAAPTLNVLPIRVHQPLEKSLERLAFELQMDIHKITNSDMVSASLSQIFEWTGIRVDFSANIVRAPTSQASTNVKFLHPSDMNLRTESENLWEAIHASHEHTVIDNTPPSIATNFTKKAFLPMLEFELYNHEDMIDISISSPLHLISEEEADKFTRRFTKLCTLEDILS